MAERRMFSCKITSSDAFKMMSVAAQALYFHLGMEADDDGFVNNPISITRSIGASVEDLEELISKRFVLRFTESLVVIKHWKINNWIRKDMYKETAYQQYRSRLILKENGAYTEAEKARKRTDSEQTCNGTVTDSSQIRSIGKDRLGKDRLDNNIALSLDNAHSPAVAEETAKSAKNPVDYNEIMSLFNRICTGFPQITKMSDRRRKAIKDRLNSGYSIQDFETVFRKAQASDFLKGANDRNWSADFDWMISDGNMVKILDGNYDNGKAKMPKASPYPSGIAADGSDPEKYKTGETIASLMRKQREAQSAR